MGCKTGKFYACNLDIYLFRRGTLSCHSCNNLLHVSTYAKSGIVPARNGPMLVVLSSVDFDKGVIDVFPPYADWLGRLLDNAPGIADPFQKVGSYDRKSIYN
ncbi:hypothetical protein J3459_009670 [Metarhizium acridum]|nr:hypothetical protein J3459_009745 [Metarhizium acridum]KAG8425839.1 hypothetical protein J3459_009670 [Metarhizium acridum]